MANVHIPTNPSLLKPVAPGAVANYRPADVKFARCEFTLPLGAISANAPTRSLIFQFCLPLTQTMRQVTNDNGVDRTLTTWHGNTNIGSMTSKETHFKVVDRGSFDVPCDLVRNPGFSTNAAVDDTLLWGEMKKRLHKAVCNMVYKDCFEHLCPNYGDNPAIALKDLSQDKVTVTTTPFA
jgi:hypothetical protein